MNTLASFQPHNTAINELKQSNSFMPSIRVGAGTSEPCVAGVVQQGDFFLSSQESMEAVSLGEWGPSLEDKFSATGCHFRAILGPWRPHALQLTEGKPDGESFVQDSEEFRRIFKLSADLKRTKAKEPVAMVGTDILIWIPPTEFNVAELTNKKRNLTPERIVEIKNNLVNGLVATFFYAKTAAQYTPAGTKPPGSIIDFSTALIGYPQGNKWWVPMGSTLLPKETLSENEYNRGVQALLEAAPKFIEVTSNQTLEEVPTEGATRRAAR